MNDFQGRWSASYWYPGSPIQQYYAALSQQRAAKLADYTRLVIKTPGNTYSATFVRPSDGAIVEVIDQAGEVVKVRELSSQPKLLCDVLNVGLLKVFWTRTG